MRRAHRQMHFLIWLALAPAVAFGVFLALSHRPGDPLTELPDAIADEAP